MIQEFEVREKLAALAAGEQSVEDFAAWLDPASWNMHADSSSEAIDLVSSVHLLLSEYDHKDLDESQLRRELESLLNDVSACVMIQANPPEAVVRRHMPSRFGANSRQISLQVRLAA